MSTNLKLPDFITESEDDIYNRMASNAPENISTVQGDLFFNHTRPVAIELARTKNMELKYNLTSRFAQTATEDDLDLCGEEVSLPRKGAEYAIQKIHIKAVPGTYIQSGKIICTPSTDDEESVEFEFTDNTIINDTGEAYVSAKCTIAGEIGNVAPGNIKILKTPINGISELINTEIIIKGVNIEEDEPYRERILEAMRHPSTSGNPADYEKWCKQMPGVGAAKIFPLWDKDNGLNGNGSVKCIIADTYNKPVTEQLIQDTFNYIETQRPIGATVTVTSAKEKMMTISATLILQNGVELEDVKSNFESSLADLYLTKVAFKKSYISYAKVGTIILGLDGVDDYTDLKINGQAANLQLATDEIAFLSSAEFTEGSE